VTSVSPRLLGLDNYTFTETLTNPETGASVTMTANAVFNEIKARRVEGNIFEFAAVEAGQFRHLRRGPQRRRPRTTPRVRRFLRPHRAADRPLTNG